MYDFIKDNLKVAINIILWFTLISCIIIGFVTFGWRQEVSVFHGVVTRFSFFNAILGAIMGGVIGIIINFISGGVLVALTGIQEEAKNINSKLSVLSEEINKNDENNDPNEGNPKKSERIGTPVMSQKNKDIQFNWQD